VDGGGRSTIAIWLVAAGLAVFAGMRLFGGAGGAGPEAVRIEGAGASGAGGVAASGDAAGRTGQERGPQVYVHVAGAVRRPGLLRVAADTRVATALERAGGPTARADLIAVNLAAKVQDGQQIVVPVKGAASQASDPSGAPAHLSTATAEQLDEIDGIGPTLAERIVEYRDAHGGFRSIEDLAQVDGIGEKRLATLRDALQP
jgi:competence protein ComEA